jgi:hypothetical protein
LVETNWLKIKSVEISFLQKTEKHTLKVKNWPSVPYRGCLIHQYLLYFKIIEAKQKQIRAVKNEVKNELREKSKNKNLNQEMHHLLLRI